VRTQRIARPDGAPSALQAESLGWGHPSEPSAPGATALTTAAPALIHPYAPGSAVPITCSTPRPVSLREVAPTAQISPVQLPWIPSRAPAVTPTLSAPPPSPQLSSHTRSTRRASALSRSVLEHERT